ncbi:MAG: hypothetical protein KIT74_05935 [Fimbriimonadales bacterium]|jgi:hypothetical protein|nr:hypothetical protein [Fimbriimonadales bacterium]
MSVTIEFNEQQVSQGPATDLPLDPFESMSDVYAWPADVQLLIDGTDYGFSKEDDAISVLEIAAILYRMIVHLHPDCESSDYFIDCATLTFARNESGETVLVSKEGVNAVSRCDYFELRHEVLKFYRSVLTTLRRNYPKLEQNLAFDEHWFIAFGESTIRPNKTLNRSGDWSE